jgi:hypothetical protein
MFQAKAPARHIVDWVPKVTEILQDPASVLVMHPGSFVEDARASPDENYEMVPGKDVRHIQHLAGESPDWKWEIVTAGFWAGYAAHVLMFRNMFRGEVPIWSIETRWRYGPDAAGDTELAEAVYALRMGAESERLQRVAKDGLFMPRVRSFTAGRPPLAYCASWTGDIRHFSGEERIESGDSKGLWHSTFHGGLIIPVS